MQTLFNLSNLHQRCFYRMEGTCNCGRRAEGLFRDRGHLYSRAVWWKANISEILGKDVEEVPLNEKCHRTRSSLSVALPFKGNSYVSQVPLKENFSFCDTYCSKALPLRLSLVFLKYLPFITLPYCTGGPCPRKPCLSRQLWDLLFCDINYTQHVSLFFFREFFY